MRLGPTFQTNLPRRCLLVTVLCAFFLLLLGARSTQADPYLPPGHEIFAGVAGAPLSSYEQAVGKHPPVLQIFSAWGEYLPAIFADAASARARLMIHITTASGTREMITPGAIARGRGDAWLIALNQAAFASGRVTYVRLMAEMDAYWNPYSAFDADGRSRGPDRSPAAYRRAWQRVALILRGGPLSAIDAELARLHMPALRTTHDLPRPRVSLLWVPQVAGSPDIPANQPRAYWPGARWVDWVGTDFYGKFPNFGGLTALYDAFPGKPFVFGEWALWGTDDPGFVDELFGWVARHGRTRMLVYNQGVATAGPFRLFRYPRAARELRRRLAGSRFPAFAPELVP